ncbi:hypothetical protein [Leptolyngbya sp. NIES-2104]|uniref:hypothetical protein n=1 Tax=Leptolyngbya sp. NIES-2104 TaxID=1552121 RepID=UPI0006EC88AC|nr:hypothetical protein [Leptolyngbya sp. NIES-2104]GAP99809.1 hypothetical protein NIES2104_63750 [Leptolyngbya sp. NIES-2104]
MISPSVTHIKPTLIVKNGSIHHIFQEDKAVSVFFKRIRAIFAIALILSLEFALFQAPVSAAPRTTMFYGASTKYDRHDCKAGIANTLKRAGIPQVNSNHSDNTFVSGYSPNVGDTLVFVTCVPLPSQGFCGGEGTMPVFAVAGVTNDADRVSNNIRNAYRPPNHEIGCL